MADLQDALGQYILYRDILEETAIPRRLYLAVPADAAHSIFDAPIGQMLLRRHQPLIFAFDPNTAEITRWIP